MCVLEILCIYFTHILLVLNNVDVNLCSFLKVKSDCKVFVCIALA